MAFSNGPTIVRDGLVLALDASDRNSYPGSGTTWYDISGAGRNFTLAESGITWNSAGYFTLDDGGATYNGATSTSTTSTLVMWIKTMDLQALFWNGIDSSYYVGAYRVGNKEYYSNCGTPDFYMDTVDYPNIYDYFPNGNWHMVEFKNLNLSSWAASNFNTYGSYTFGNGACASILVYNRNITAQESIQNYNALKSRFGL